jgi:isopentenyldiphosphate isomerase
MSRVIVVDKDDVVLGVKERDSLSEDDIYRISVLWITNHSGEILLAQRSSQKKKHPLRWGVAVAGTIEEGEEYDDNIVKEAWEEIGLEVDLNDLTKGPKTYFKGGGSNHFAQSYLYTATIDIGSLTLEPLEVAQVQWFTPEKLATMIREAPELFTPSAPTWIELFLQNT